MVHSSISQVTLIFARPFRVGRFRAYLAGELLAIPHLGKDLPARLPQHRAGTVILVKSGLPQHRFGRVGSGSREKTPGCLRRRGSYPRPGAGLVRSRPLSAGQQ